MIVNWTESALTDLRTAGQQLGRHSQQYGSSFVASVFARTELLIDHPRLGSIVPEHDDDALRELFEHPYRIIYRIVSEERIDVVALVHSSRRLPRGL